MATSLLAALRSGASNLITSARFSTQATVSRRSPSWSSIRTSLRGAGVAPCCTACAHFSKASSRVMPRSIVTGSNFVGPTTTRRRIGIAAVANAHEFGELAKPAHAAHPHDRPAIPHDAQRVASSADAIMPRYEARARLILGKAADADDDELGGPKRRKAHHQIDDALIGVLPGHGRGVAAHEKRLLRLVARQRALPKQAEQEIRNARADVLPQRRAVRLEHGRLQAARDAVLDEQLEPPQRNELERVRNVVSRQRARAPDDDRPGQRTQPVDPDGIE